MNSAIKSAVGVLLERLHHGGRHSDPGIISIQIDRHLKCPNDANEYQEDQAAATSAAARDLSFPIQGKRSWVFECVKPVEAGLRRQPVHVVVMKLFSGSILLFDELSTRLELFKSCGVTHRINLLEAWFRNNCLIDHFSTFLDHFFIVLRLIFKANEVFVFEAIKGLKLVDDGLTLLDLVLHEH